MILFEYWNRVNPPTTELLALYIGFKPSSKQEEMTAVEEQIVTGLGPVRPFDRLPAEVQQWVLESKIAKAEKINRLNR